MGNEFVSGSIASTENGSGADSVAPLLTYKEIFEEQCPYYMAMGMTYEEYWNGDPMLCKFYRKAHKIKKKQQNEMLWLQGMYIYEALCDVSPVLNANAPKGTKVTPYAEKPYPITSEDMEIFKREQAEKELQKKKAQFESMMAAFNTNFRKKKGDDENADRGNT